MKSSSSGCLKYLVFFFNLLIFICGIAALGIGIWALVNENSFKHILVDSPWVFYGIYVIIAVGAALFLIGFLGCCGAIKENRCMLGTFFVIVLIIFIAQLAGAIFIYVKRGDVLKAVHNSIGQYGVKSPTGNAIKEGWDLLQLSVKCCGEYSYTDWSNNTAWKARYPGKLVPDSCCYSGNDGKPINTASCQAGLNGFVHKNGCVYKLSNSITTVAIVAGVILLVELLAMIFACCLYKQSNEYGRLA